jgi:carboxylesterase
MSRGDGPLGALVLHGLTGTPHEVRVLALALAERGFAVRVPALAGHGDLAALEASSWREWYASVEQAWLELHDGGRRRAMVVGFSLGGLLALRLAALRPLEVTAIATLSVPLALRGWQRQAIATLARLRGLGGIGRWVGMLPKRGPDVRIQRELAGSPSLRGMPWPALAQLVALQDEVGELLPHVRAPLLVLHGRLDHTAPVGDSERLAQRTGSVRVQRVILPRSFHQVGLDVDRDAAAAALVRFAVAELGDPHARGTTA